MTRPELEPFGDQGELLRLLGAERAVLEPDRATRDRMWARLAGALMVPAPPRPLGVGKVLVAAVAAGAIASLAWWGARPGPRASMAPPPPPPQVVLPAPAAPAPTLVERALAPEPARDPRRPRPRPSDTLGEEQRLVEQAREALAHGRPQEATAALEAHARRFARGQLSEERESLAIRAELTQGQARQARARAEAFLASHPDSLFAPIVRALGARAAASAPDPDEP